MSYKIKYPENVTEQMVREMAERIDPECYPGLVIDVEHELEIFRANDRSRIALMEDDKLIGHLCMFPVTEKVYRQIVDEGASYLTWIDPKEILRFEPGGRYKLLIDSFAILPKYQELAACQLLIDSTFTHISALARQNIEIEEIIAFIVNYDLLPLLKRANFKRVGATKDGVPIYSCKSADRRSEEAAAIRKKVQSVIYLIADYCGKNPEEISGETYFRRDLGLKSIDLICLIARAEEELGINIPDSKYSYIEQIKDLAALL